MIEVVEGAVIESGKVIYRSRYPANLESTATHVVTRAFSSRYACDCITCGKARAARNNAGL